MDDRMESLAKILLDRLWNAYEKIDERRRRAFLLLYTSSLVTVMLLAEPGTITQVPLLNISTAQSVVLIALPLMLAALMVNYLFLCAHTITSYTQYIEFLSERYEGEIWKLSSKGWVYGSLKMRDVSEGLNIFLFPVRPVQGYDKRVVPSASAIGHLLINLQLIIVALFPLVAYVVSAMKAYGVTPANVCANIALECGYGRLLLYAAPVAIVLAAATYLGFRVGPARADFIRSMIRQSPGPTPSL